MSKRVSSSGAVGVRGLAIVEAVKGPVILLGGFGLLSFTPQKINVISRSCTQSHTE
jgi:hypothetical protein